MASTTNAQETWQSFNGDDFFHMINAPGGKIVAYIDNNGDYFSVGGGLGSFAPALNTAAQPTLRGVDSEPSLNYAGSTTITGSVAAVRGNTTVASGNTVAGGFVYGTQGKVTVKGTLATANFTAGVIGQLDLSAATLTASGPIAAIWGDMGAAMSASALTNHANLNVLQLTNTVAGTPINAAMLIETNATYLMDVSNGTLNPFFTNTVPTTLSGSLKVNTSAGVRYIALYSAAS
jgi:hypothetical protein